MKNVAIFALALACLLEGFALALVLSVGADYQWIASPIAILVSASITLVVASIGWHRTSRMEGANRTISYILKEFPIDRKLLDHLGAAQNKLMANTSLYATKDSCSGKILVDLASLEAQVNELSEEERSALDHVVGRTEMILSNLELGYFDQALVDSHLGEDFGTALWFRAWPYIVYEEAVQNIYMRAKGIALSDNSGVYRSFRSMIQRHPNIKDKYPLYGERATQDAAPIEIPTALELN